MFRKTLLKTLCAAAICAIAMAGAGGASAQDKKPVIIGYGIARTGQFAVATPVQEQAYKLWRDQVNAQGGLKIAGQGRRPIKFLVYDDQSKPSNEPKIYEKLINEDKVDLLLAPWGTPMHIAIAPVVERNHFPLVGATASSTLVRDLKVKYMWFNDPLPDEWARALPKLLNANNIKTAAVLTLQLPLSLEVKKFLMPALSKSGIKVVVDQEYPPDIKDMTGMLSTVKSADPDAIIALSYPGDSILYMNQARELGLKAKFQLLLIGPTEPFFTKKFGKNLDGIVTVGQWSPKQKMWPQAQKFFDAYKKKWGEPPDYLDSVSSYISCQVLEQAVAKAGLDREKIRDTIANGTFETINGPARYKGVVNVARPAGFLQIQKGEFQIIWPPDIATSKFRPKEGWAD